MRRAKTFLLQLEFLRNLQTDTGLDKIFFGFHSIMLNTEARRRIHFAFEIRAIQFRQESAKTISAVIW